MASVGVSVTVALDESDATAVLAGEEPFAVAVFVTEPAVTSAAVAAYVPVQTSKPSGGSVDCGQTRSAL